MCRIAFTAGQLWAHQLAAGGGDFPAVSARPGSSFCHLHQLWIQLPGQYPSLHSVSQPVVCRCELHSAVDEYRPFCILFHSTCPAPCSFVVCQKGFLRKVCAGLSHTLSAPSSLAKNGAKPCRNTSSNLLKYSNSYKHVVETYVVTCPLAHKVSTSFLQIRFEVVTMQGFKAFSSRLLNTGKVCLKTRVTGRKLHIRQK